MPKPIKFNKQTEKFYKNLVDYIDEWVSEAYDKDSFREFFVKNFPKYDNTTSTKKKKDPNAPKKPRNAYVIFSSDPEIRKKIESKNPDAKQTEKMKFVSELWKSDKYRTYTEDGEFTDTQGKKYNYTKKCQKYLDLAVKDKERYEEEMKNYTPSEDYQEVKKEKKPIKSPYIFFCQENRSRAKQHVLESGEFENISASQTNQNTTKLLGKWWNEMKIYNDDGEFSDKQGKFDYTDDAMVYVNMTKDNKNHVATK